MSNQPRSEQGRFQRQRDPEDVLDAMDPGEPYVTSELADTLEWPRRTVYEALDELHEGERVVKKQANARAVMWIRPAESTEVPA